MSRSFSMIAFACASIAMTCSLALAQGRPKTPAKEADVTQLVTELGGATDATRRGVMLRAYTVVGTNTFTPEQHNAVFKALQAQLNVAQGDALHFACKCMLILNPDQAVERVTNPSIFNTKNEDLAYIIWALDDARVKLPPDLLVPMMSGIKQLSEKPHKDFENARAYEFALPLLARTNPAAAKPLIDEALVAKRDETLRGAAAAMTVLADVEDAYAVACDQIFPLNKAGGRQMRLEQAPTEVQNYYIAFEVDSLVSNGGISQLVSNHDEAFAARAPAALEAIGATQLAKILHRAFPPSPSADWDKLTSEFYKVREREDIMRLLKLYAAKHPEHFRARSQ